MKRILVIATGGTIASLPQGQGLAPGLTGEEIVNFVPQAGELCRLDFVQPMNVDSTNMRPRDWLRISVCITETYANYDGFVVLHGTDTMAYTAAALSYLVQDSAKPIVLTGSQQPMAAPFTDAKLNLYQSLLYACDDASHDVSVVFGGKVICGTRAHKQRTMSYNAFTSVNYPLPAIIRGERIVRNGAMGMTLTPAEDLRVQETASKLQSYRNLDERVIVLKLTPELKPSIFGLLKRDYDAVILETFGMGGIPEHADESFEQAIFDWIDSGRFVVVTTQVNEEGLDLGVYEVGHAYANSCAILRGDDMSTEALVAKTMWVLGQTHDPAQVSELFYRPVNHDRALATHQL